MYQSLPTGKEANQTAFEAVQVSGYNCRSDVTAHALTLQLPLEGKLLRGGVTGVLKTANGQWLHCQQHGAIPDFYISTREVNMPLPCRCGVSAVLARCLRTCQLGECAALKFAGTMTSACRIHTLGYQDLNSCSETWQDMLDKVWTIVRGY